MTKDMAKALEELFERLSESGPNQLTTEDLAGYLGISIPDATELVVNQAAGVVLNSKQVIVGGGTHVNVAQGESIHQNNVVVLTPGGLGSHSGTELDAAVENLFDSSRAYVDNISNLLKNSQRTSDSTILTGIEGYSKSVVDAVIRAMSLNCEAQEIIRALQEVKKTMPHLHTDIGYDKMDSLRAYGIYLIIMSILVLAVNRKRYTFIGQILHTEFRENGLPPMLIGLMRYPVVSRPNVSQKAIWSDMQARLVGPEGWLKGHLRRTMDPIEDYVKAEFIADIGWAMAYASRYRGSLFSLSASYIEREAATIVEDFFRHEEKAINLAIPNATDFAHKLDKAHRVASNSWFNLK